MITENTYKQVVKLLDAGLNVKYVSSYVNIDIATVTRIEDGTYLHVRVARPKPLEKSNVVYPRSLDGRTLKPAALPPIPDMRLLDDKARILLLTKRGMAATKILRHLKSRTWSPRSVNKIAQRALGSKRIGIANAKQNQITVTDMPIILECMRRLNKNRYMCEICLDHVPKGCIVHHTRYGGATVYDLMFVCGSCNLARENVGLY